MPDCNKPSCPFCEDVIIKYRDPNYYKYIGVWIKDSVLVAHPGGKGSYGTDTGCIKLHEDYFFSHCTFGNTILKIEKKDWPEFYLRADSDSVWHNIFEYVMDYDPFIEKYKGENPFTIDELNTIIDRGELGEYFERIK